MSSDEGSINSDLEVSDNEQHNEILKIDEDLQDGDQQTEEVHRDETAAGDGGEDGEKKTVKPKRVVRNPQPRLNEETLKGPKGIAALESYFQRVKFKGKGKEQEDLNVVMKTYEYWCHRLFPKFPFDTCIERLEKLGNKRAVQTHIKRIRFDLLVEDKPILSDSDEEPNVDGFVNIENDEINQQQNQQFDDLFNSSAPAPITKPVELTAEQLERIRLNKERAERLKQERLKQIRDKAQGNLQVSSQLPGTSGLQSETRLEQLDATESTESDLCSQEDYTQNIESNRNVQETLDETEGTTIFDHESKVKGKTSITGASVKKKSRKKTAIFNDEMSDEENKDVTVSNKRISDEIELLDIDQNSSDSDFVQKKRNKNNKIFDSDDDQSVNEESKKHKKGSGSKHLNLNDNSDNENAIENNIFSVKNLSKRSTVLDTDESDQEVNQPSNEINRSKGGNEAYDLDINHSNQDGLSSAGSKYLNVKDKNFGGSNISGKKLPKRSTLLDTEESDEEMEQVNQSSKKLDISKENKKKANGIDSNYINQEMDTDEVHLCDINNANASTNNCFNKQSDLNSSEEKPNSSLFNSEMDGLANVPEAVDSRLNNKKSVEITGE